MEKIDLYFDWSCLLTCLFVENSARLLTKLLVYEMLLYANALDDVDTTYKKVQKQEHAESHRLDNVDAKVQQVIAAFSHIPCGTTGAGSEVSFSPSSPKPGTPLSLRSRRSKFLPESGGEGDDSVLEDATTIEMKDVPRPQGTEETE
jgi:hypothetical protein